MSNRPGPDFRLESAGAGGSIISTVPMRVTKIEYSSDERIKEDIHYLDDAELDDIYDRFTQIKLANYRYTDEWLKIRGVDDVVVRGESRRMYARYSQSVSKWWITTPTQPTISPSMDSTKLTSKASR